MTWLYEILGVPFGYVLKFLYETVALQNYALAIILLTLFARILMIPTSVSQQKGMAKTQRLQAKLRRIQTKYAGNQQKIQEETTALYQREGYNPMGAGCAPMLVQFLLLFGLIGAIYYPLSHSFGFDEAVIKDLALAMRQVPELSSLIEGKKISDFNQEIYIIGSISKGNLTYEFLSSLVEAGKIKITSDLAVLESAITEISKIDFNLFGLALGDVPMIDGVYRNEADKMTGINFKLWIVPVLSFLSTMATGLYSQMKQKKNNPAAANNAMMTGCMTFGMPLFSLYWVINYPIGIGVYWIASSVFGFISTVIIGNIYSPKKVMAKLMVDETVERRSKENSIKLAAEIKEKKN